MTRKLLLLIAIAGFAACSTNNSELPSAAVGIGSAEKENAVQDVAVITIEARVKKINHKSRQITLTGPNGNELTFVASDEVKRFKEIKRGDKVVVEYLASLLLEQRTPTAEEKKKPTTVSGTVERNPNELPPGVMADQTVKTVVKVVGLDKNANTVTVKAPNGNVVTVAARRPERLESLKIGDTIAVTYTEAVAVSIEPVK